jgi:hypothetical protein
MSYWTLAQMSRWVRGCAVGRIALIAFWKNRFGSFW